MAMVRWLHGRSPWAEARRWNPWAELHRLQEQMSRLVESGGYTRPTRAWTPMPPINVSQTNDAVVVTAEVPGVKPEDLSLTITGNTLLLKGVRKPSVEDAKVSYVRRERPTGEFSRSIELPEKAQSDKAAAEFAQGLLTIRIPKAAEAVPRHIAVKANVGQGNKP